ncbi:MAG: hypothetical protein WC827_02835 [Candidatus Paceibacterota bacterium]|jgi:hypothetical protein
MYDQDKIKEYLAKLPQEIKTVLYSLDYSKLLQEIVIKNKLLIDQAGKLEIETTLVMSGLTPLNDYVSALSKELGITEEKAREIAHDVDNLIFKSIRKSLEAINNEEKEDDLIIEQRAKKEMDREYILSGIENPETIKEKDESISISSLNSNNNIGVKLESFSKGVEIKKENQAEITPGAILQPQIFTKREVAQSISENISPIKNIVETKKETSVIVPRETVIIEEKAKLPERQADQYREPII